jgi:hypothetical protein
MWALIFTDRSLHQFFEVLIVKHRYFSIPLAKEHVGEHGKRLDLTYLASHRNGHWPCDLSNLTKPQYLMWSSVVFNSDPVGSLSLITLYKPSSQSSCTDIVNGTDCFLRPAIVNYSLEISNNIATLLGATQNDNDAVRLLKPSELGALPLSEAELASLAQGSHQSCPTCDANVDPNTLTPQMQSFYGLALAAHAKYGSAGQILPKGTFKTIGESRYLTIRIHELGQKHFRSLQHDLGQPHRRHLERYSRVNVPGCACGGEYHHDTDCQRDTKGYANGLPVGVHVPLYRAHGAIGRHCLHFDAFLRLVGARSRGHP